MVLRCVKFLGLLFPLALLLSGSALANNCNNFASYTCANGVGNNIHITGQAATNSDVGTSMGLITGNSFTVTMTGNKSAADIIIIAAFTGSITGTLNGHNFTSMSGAAFQSALGAISNTLSALGLSGSPSSFGYVDLNSPLSANGSLTVNISGLPAGTALYALALNPVTTCVHHDHGTETCTTTMMITEETPNSEAGITGAPAVVPEPGTLGLLGTGLVGLATMVRRRFKR